MQAGEVPLPAGPSPSHCAQQPPGKTTEATATRDQVAARSRQPLQPAALPLGRPQVPGNIPSNLRAPSVKGGCKNPGPQDARPSGSGWPGALTPMGWQVGGTSSQGPQEGRLRRPTPHRPRTRWGVCCLSLQPVRETLVVPVSEGRHGCRGQGAGSLNSRPQRPPGTAAVRHGRPAGPVGTVLARRPLTTMQRKGCCPGQAQFYLQVGKRGEPKGVGPGDQDSPPGMRAWPSPGRAGRQLSGAVADPLILLFKVLPE